MNQEEYLKLKKSQGYPIPASIDPFRLGLVDTDSIKAKNVIFKDLLRSGELVHIETEAGRTANALAALLTSALIKGECLLQDHWQLERKCPRNCLVITDKAIMSDFHSEMNNFGVSNYKLIDSGHIYSHSDDWPQILVAHKPAVCVLNIRTRLLSKPEAKAVWDMLATCKSEGIAILLFDSGSTLNFPGIDTEVKVWQKGSESLIDVLDAQSGASLDKFALTITVEGLKSRIAEEEEFNNIQDRQHQQTLPAVDPNFNLEDV